MARPRAFDESDVIDRAIRQFWSHGYEATSIDDLCAATGLNRSSLYRTFGSKRELLNTALGAYERDAVQRIGRLLDGYPIREALRRFLMGVFQDENTPTRQWGCLIGNCAGELAAHDEPAQKRLWRSLQQIEGLLCRALKRAQQDGALSPDADAESIARFLMTQAQGLRLVAKTHPPRPVLENIVDTTLSILR